jgi:hypothetical protein
LTLAAAGEPLEALKYYTQHVKLLRDEFDAKASPKIELAAERIHQDLSYSAGGTMASASADGSLDIANLPTLFSDSPLVARRNSGPIRLPGRVSGPNRPPGRNSGQTRLPANPPRPNS